jgi:hypothetical protein
LVIFASVIRTGKHIDRFHCCTWVAKSLPASYPARSSSHPEILVEEELEKHEGGDGMQVNSDVLPVFGVSSNVVTRNWVIDWYR